METFIITLLLCARVFKQWNHINTLLHREKHTNGAEMDILHAHMLHVKFYWRKKGLNTVSIAAKVNIYIGTVTKPSSLWTFCDWTSERRKDEEEEHVLVSVLGWGPAKVKPIRLINIFSNKVNSYWNCHHFLGSILLCHSFIHTGRSYLAVPVREWPVVQTCLAARSHESWRTDTVSVHIVANSTIKTGRTVLVAMRAPFLIWTVYKEMHFS